MAAIINKPTAQQYVDDAVPSARAADSGETSAFTWSFVGICAALFLLSLGVQVAHHLLTDHSYVMFAFDGKHYLATSQAMAAALMLLLKGDQSAFLRAIADPAFCKNLVWDGPVIPGIPAVIYALLGRIPKESDWASFAVFFSVLASYSAVLVAVATRLLTGSNKLSLTAGLLFALYPTTLLATGVYRSEVLAVSLLLTLLLALYRAPGSALAAIFAGIVGGIFAMVKPVMIPAIGLLCFFTGLHGRKVKTLTLLALAGVLTIAPWSIYTAVDCGKLSITAERGPSYNAGVGTDLAANGWCTMPETPHVATSKLNKSPLAIFEHEWRSHPFELSKLTIRRVTRLWSNPWNDFREPVFGLPIQVQVAWHLILVCLGFMGLSLYAFFPPQGERRLLGNLAAIALLSHLSFIMFQTMGRYAYTSMALLVIFAAFGIGRLQRLVGSSRAFTVPGAVPFSATLASALRTFGGTAAAALGVAFALLIFNCDSFTHAGEGRELSHVLAPGATAGRAIGLAAGALPTGALILIDIAQDPRDQANPESLAVRFNGHLLSGPVLPLNCFNGAKYFLFDTMAEHSAFMRNSVKDFRQWRAVRVDPDAQLLKQGGLNEIEITNKGRYPITVFGDSASRENKIVPLPSPDYFASDRMLVSLTSMESRINSLIPEAVESQHSYIKGGDGAENLSDNLRLQLALFDAGNGLAAAGSDGKAQEFELKPGQFHWYARTEDGLRLNKDVLKSVGAVGCDLKLAPLPAAATQVQVTVSGLARKQGGPGRLGVSAALVNDQGLPQQLDQFADYVSVPASAAGQNPEQAWSQFELTDVVPLSRLGGAAKVSGLNLAFLPCPRLESCYGPGRQCSNIDVKDLRVRIKPLYLIDIAGRSLSVY
ncbi:MAG: hypothetical protein JSS86_11855 [Cyanobacteria bacterium SZAS LIN-2]|nr:hypothetical protein [Cyanobacteria bacterium SZAS LIN-2]